MIYSYLFRKSNRLYTIPATVRSSTTHHPHVSAQRMPSPYSRACRYPAQTNLAHIPSQTSYPHEFPRHIHQSDGEAFWDLSAELRIAIGELGKSLWASSNDVRGHGRAKPYEMTPGSEGGVCLPQNHQNSCAQESGGYHWGREASQRSSNDVREQRL